MGTRADFYVGRGKDAEWLGSIAWDGYDIPENIQECQGEETYREDVKDFLTSRDDATFPEQGWPWPWEDSNTTDYAYAYDDKKVYKNCFGRGWLEVHEEETDEYLDAHGRTEFPDMSEVQNVTLGQRSGVIVARRTKKGMTID